MVAVYNDEITNTAQRARFKRLLNIESRTSDNQGDLLYDVLNLDPTSCDDEYELTYLDFKKYLYYKDVDSVNENITKLQNNLRSGIRYHYIHSNGKNGKSTFVWRFSNENKNQFNSLIVDFKDFQLNDGEPNLLNKTIDLFNRLGQSVGDKLITEMEDTLIHIKIGKIKLTSGIRANDKRVSYNDLFISFRKELLSLIGNLKNEIKGENLKEIINPLFELFQPKFKKLISKLYNDDENTAIQLLDFYLLILLKISGDKNKRTVIFFDNIDDILTHAAEYLTGRIFPQICAFIEVINSYINLSTKFIDKKIIDEVALVFCYRTANFISSKNYIQLSPTFATHKEELLYAPVYALSSVKAAGNIISKKIDFYNILCYSFDIEKYPEWAALKNIFESFDFENNEYSYLPRLWNGNHLAFIQCFKSLPLIEINSQIINNKSVSMSVKKSAVIHFVTRYYSNKDHIHRVKSSTLTSAFQYVFTNELDEDEDPKCNLLRMFLTYIFNSTNEISSEKNHIGDIGNNQGVSLLKVFDSLTQFKSGKKIFYNKSTFQKLFNRVFHDDIDAFDYFIVCSKNTDFIVGKKNILVKNMIFLKN